MVHCYFCHDTPLLLPVCLCFALDFLRYSLHLGERVNKILMGIDQKVLSSESIIPKRSTFSISFTGSSSSPQYLNVGMPQGLAFSLYLLLW